jgi:hypothetical protein
MNTRPTPDHIRGLARDLAPLPVAGVGKDGERTAASAARIRALLEPTADTLAQADAALERLIERAVNDVELELGQRAIDPAALTETQQLALRRATTLQAVALLLAGGAHELGLELGDGTRLTFARGRSRSRLAVRAKEHLAQHGLNRWAATVPPAT